MKTNTTFIPIYLFWDINTQACPELRRITYVKNEIDEYQCDRPSQTYCHQVGWCPLRFTTGCVPKMRLNDPV